MSGFSVLLPVYAGDSPEFLERSVRSVTADQTRKPDQLVIVQDGPVPPALEQTIERCVRTGVPTKLVILPCNVGLARALTRGLRACRFDIVARQDADDVSLPQRFERQIPLLEGGAELVGTAIAEFSDEAAPGLVRYQPLTRAQIAKVLAFRDPFNHPSVAFSKAAVERCGGYQHLDLMEDYWLFARMVKAGVTCLNLPDVLVLYRVGAGAYRRRGGVRLLRSELKLQENLRKARIVSGPVALRNVVVRGGYRFVPTSLRKAAYQGALKLRRR